jgi:diguanylate cyclase (GGDEF)-like protein
MWRLVDRWWLIGSALIATVIALTCVLYVGESARHLQQQRATEHQAVALLGQSIDDVLAREVVLARVVGTLGGVNGARWPALSNVVLSQPLANATGYIQPVSERDRASFERRTGLKLVESPRTGVLHVARPRPLHLVLTAFRQVGAGPPPLGLDVAASPLRRALLSQAGRTGRQLASPPVDFLARRQPTRGVVVYAAVRDRLGRLIGWVSANYKAEQLASTVTDHMPSVHVTIRDGGSTLTSSPGALTSPAATIAVAGRRWSVWAKARRAGISPVPWLVLGLGLVLAAAVMVILRQAATAARYSTEQLALRDAEEAAVGQIAMLVAQGATPDAVFKSVAEQIATLFDSIAGAVSRFDAAANHGTILGAWTRDGQELAGGVYALDGVTSSAEVFRTEKAARIDGGYDSDIDPIASVMANLKGTNGVAAPITVAGNLWGALGAAYGEHAIPAGVETRLERFASLVGLAISNADARDRIARQASSDPLTGISNRRVFDERLIAELARAHRYGRTISLALLDLDCFKAINDLHGHQAGDRVLVLFAQLLTAHAREGELVARIGGDEFAWLMPETDPHGALAAAERVRTCIAKGSFENAEALTLSAGVCSSQTAIDADTLVRDADRALYWAKDSGRNMTFLYTDEARATLGRERAGP